MELIRQLWLGNVSLARTYWLYFICVAVLFKITEKILITNLFLLTGGYRFVLYLFDGIQAIYFGFMLIAIWRSANKYNGRILWAGLAKLGVIIGFINITSSIVNLGGPTSINLAEDARSMNQSLPAKLDSFTQLDKVVADGQKLVYHLTISSSARNMDFNKLEQGIRGIFRTEMCLRSDIKNYLSHSVTFVYVYKSIDNSYIRSIELSQADCNNP
jgi:hypothetical protein